MEEYRQEQINELGRLICASEDLESAYLNAAEEETSEELKELYRQYTAAIAKAVAELKTEVGALGGDAGEIALETEDNPGQTSDGRPDIQDQQSRSLSLYEKALDLPWPGNITETLQRHYTVLQEAEQHLDEVHSMRAPERSSDADSDTPDSIVDEDRREAA